MVYNCHSSLLDWKNMEYPSILNNIKDDFDIWYKTKDPVFSDISLKSRVVDRWVRFDPIRNGKYKDSVIKPINAYVQSLYPAPTLLSIDSGIVRLQQKNHAEFFLLEGSSGLRNVDRPWMRQYYNTEFKMDKDVNCFDDVFKFYVPWYIDLDVEVSYEKPTEDSPFKISPCTSFHKQVDPDSRYLEPDFVPFKFKRVGPHMVDHRFGKIKRYSPMFDIVFKVDDIMEQRVRNFYEQDQVLPF